MYAHRNINYSFLDKTLLGSIKGKEGRQIKGRKERNGREGKGRKRKAGFPMDVWSLSKRWRVIEII